MWRRTEQQNRRCLKPTVSLCTFLFEEDEGNCWEEGKMANLFNTFDAQMAARDQRRGRWGKGMQGRATTYCGQKGNKSMGVSVPAGERQRWRSMCSNNACVKDISPFLY